MIAGPWNSQVQTCDLYISSLYDSGHCDEFVKQMQEGFMSVQNRFQIVAIVILATVVVIMLGRGASGAETQDPASLDRRISMLEQRFYTLETSMNRLQQVITSQRSTGSSSSVSAQEIDQLQAEVQRL